MAHAARQVGRFEIIREVGRGGMAVVYLARQIDLDRDVALKELPAFHAGDPAVVARFLRESRIAGSLSHPNIVTVHDYFEHEGIPYISMEFIERGSLRPLVRRLTLAQIAGVLEGMLAGLAHGHAHGIVHRDLKPENLMVTSEGRIKIADFGIAKAFNQASSMRFLTATGTTVGTPAYMAPEQAMAKGIGPRTDLYTAGVIAYELLVGRVPFHDTDTPVAILLRHVNDPPPPPRSINPDLDPQLAEWVEALLSKDPEGRPESATEAWDILEEIIIGLIGPRWRRDARLLDAPATVAPLTPAPFEEAEDGASLLDGGAPSDEFLTFQRGPKGAAPPPPPPAAATPPVQPEVASTPQPTPAPAEATPPAAAAPPVETPAPVEPTPPPIEAAPPPPAVPTPAPVEAAAPHVATPPPAPIPEHETGFETFERSSPGAAPADGAPPAPAETPPPLAPAGEPPATDDGFATYERPQRAAAAAAAAAAATATPPPAPAVPAPEPAAATPPPADAVSEPAAATATPPLLPDELDEAAEALTAAPMSTPATDDSFEWPAAKPKRTTGGGRRPPLAIIGAVVAAIAAVLVVVLLLRGGDSGGAADPTSSTASTSASEPTTGTDPTSTVSTVEDRVLPAIERAGVSATGDAVVLADPRGRVVRLSTPGLGNATRIPDAAHPRAAALSGGSLWVADDEGVSQRSPTTLEVTSTADLPGAFALAGGVGEPLAVATRHEGKGRACVLEAGSAPRCAAFGFTPSGLGVAGGRVFVADADGGRVIPLKADGKRLVAEDAIDVGKGPHGQMAAADGTLYVPVERGVAAVDLSAGTAETIELTSTPAAVWALPGRLFATLPASGELAVLDTSTEDAEPRYVASVGAPSGIGGPARGGRVYTADSVNREVAIHDANTGDLVKTVPVDALEGAPVRPLRLQRVTIDKSGRTVTARLTFTGQGLTIADVQTIDSSIADGGASFQIRLPGIATGVRTSSGDGLTVRVADDAGRLVVRLSAGKGVFESMSAPERSGRAVAVGVTEPAPVVTTDPGTGDNGGGGTNTPPPPDNTGPTVGSPPTVG